MKTKQLAMICASVLLGVLAITLSVVLTRSNGDTSANEQSAEVSGSTSDGDASGGISADNSSASTSGNATGSGNSSSNSLHVQWGIRNGSTRSRGVNLGGWLVAEYWMTQDSSVWLGVESDNALGGEYIAITAASDPSTMRARLEAHHSTFITEDDIKEIAAVGLNTVRVPIGWWILGRDDYDTSNSQRWRAFPTDTLDCLDLLITKWAKTHNVAVLISMHAAKGSQNGEQHSAPTDLGEMFWSAYPENVATTVEVVSSLADRYKDEDAFLGFTLLNGPAGTTDESVMLAYYKEAYTAIRATGNDCVLSVMALSYGEGELADFMLAADNYINVWIEWHPYFAFGYDDDSNARLIAAVTDTYQASVTSWNKREGHNALFIGEWSVAVNEGQFADQVDHFYSFAAEQFAVIAQAEAGWTFFSWKTSGEYTGWSMMALLADSKLRALLEQSIKM